MRTKRVWILFISLVLCSTQAVARAKTVNDLTDHLKLALPKFRTAIKRRTPLGSMLVIHASVDTKNLNENDLVTIACYMHKKYALEEEFILRIFDNYDAAKRYQSDGEGNSRATANSFRAEYGFSSKTKTQELRWRPSSDWPHKWVLIDTGHCARPSGLPES